MTNESKSENRFRNSRFGQSCRMNNFKETLFVDVGSAEAATAVGKQRQDATCHSRKIEKKVRTHYLSIEMNHI